jgi:leucyl aminopeptidase
VLPPLALEHSISACKRIYTCLYVLQFVDVKVQWMHIDMAGPVWSDKKKTGTGFGVSTLVEWVVKNSS